MAGAKNRRVDPRMRAPRNYFSQHCSPSPPPPPLPTPLLLFFFFSLFSPRFQESKIAFHDICHGTWFLFARFITSLVLDSSNTLFLSSIIANAGENPPFSVFLLPFLFSLSLFFFFFDGRTSISIPRVFFSRQVFKFCAIGRLKLFGNERDKKKTRSKTVCFEISLGIRGGSRGRMRDQDN